MQVSLSEATSRAVATGPSNVGFCFEHPRFAVDFSRSAHPVFAEEATRLPAPRSLLISPVAAHTGPISHLGLRRLAHDGLGDVARIMLDGLVY